MWTYLIILLSIALAAGVFIRRLVLNLAAKKDAEIGEIAKKTAKTGRKLKSGRKSIKTEAISRNEQYTVQELCAKAETKIQAGKEDDAIKYFVQALVVDEANLEVQNRLAMLYMQKQMYGAAAALFKSLADLTNEAVHFSHLGLALYNQKLFEEAKAAYQKAVDLDPSRAQRFVSLALVYKELKQLQNAVIALNKALEIDEENKEAMAFLEEIRGEMERAEETGEN